MPKKIAKDSMMERLTLDRKIWGRNMGRLGPEIDL